MTHTLPRVLLATLAAAIFAGCPHPEHGDPREDIALEWITLIREASLEAGEMPTVEARLFHHFSLALYEAWAAYDPVATGYLSGDRLEQPESERGMAQRAEAISHAVYALARHKFSKLADAPPKSPPRLRFEAFAEKMRAHGYLDANDAPLPSAAQALGEEVARLVLAYGLDDGANEPNGYEDSVGYLTVNPPISAVDPGTNNVLDPARWQEIVLPSGLRQHYLTPHWGLVRPFAIPYYNEHALRFDPEPPPAMQGPARARFIQDMRDVLAISHALDPGKGEGAEPINLSPRVRGLQTPGDYESTGHPFNPATGQPYEDNIVLLGDYLRVLAMYLDGSMHTTPAPWWNEVAVDLCRGSGIFSQLPAAKPRRHNLEFDVKLFFTLNGAIHDAAIAVWDVKLAYDSSRPMTGIRYLGENGLLPLEPGFIERIAPGDPLAGPEDQYAGENKVFCWAGPNQGVQWMRAAEWMGYQPADFVCPPFPGYTSGHTAMARAATSVFAGITADPYVPGGLATYTIHELAFENDLTAPLTFTIATWRDWADEIAFGRLCSGVHTPSDLHGSKPIGEAAAQIALEYARQYFDGDGPPQWP